MNEIGIIDLYHQVLTPAMFDDEKWFVIFDYKKLTLRLVNESLSMDITCPLNAIPTMISIMKCHNKEHDIITINTTAGGLYILYRGTMTFIERDKDTNELVAYYGCKIQQNLYYACLYCLKTMTPYIYESNKGLNKSLFDNLKYGLVGMKKVVDKYTCFIETFHKKLLTMMRHSSIADCIIHTVD